MQRVNDVLKRRLFFRSFLCGLVFLASAHQGGTLYASDAEIERELLAAGTESETELLIQRSGVPGPTVMVVGGVHGNEPAGALAAEVIATWPIQRGILIVVPRANVPGLKSSSRFIPGVEREVRDLNRNFRVTEEGVETSGEMAPVLWAVVERFQPDWLFDLHEGYDFHQINNDSVGSSVVHDQSPEAAELAAQMLESINQTIEEPLKHFVPRGPPIAGSLARAVADCTPGHAMILETTTRDQRRPFRARQHRRMISVCLQALEMIDAEIDENLLVTPLAADQQVITIAIYQDGGIGAHGVPNLYKAWADRDDCLLRVVCGQDIRAGVLDQFQIVCFGGGSGRGQLRSLEASGAEEVRRFVSEGGGFIGVCGGAFLACQRLEILDAQTKSRLWRRGGATLDVEFSEAGRQLFHTTDDRLPIRYHNGPIIERRHDDDLEDYEVLAWFREEVSNNGSPEGIMIDSPAIVLGAFGEGQVLCFSPHPESTQGPSRERNRHIVQLALTIVLSRQAEPEEAAVPEDCFLAP